MYVYIPFCIEMLDTITHKAEKLFIERCFNCKQVNQTSWIKFNVSTQMWTYFEVSKADPTVYTRRVGTYVDFTNLMLITNDVARLEYAKHNCNHAWIKQGVATNENS